MVAGGVFEIRVENAGGVVGLMGRATLVSDEEFILSEDAFDVIAILWIAHDDSNEIEMVLFGGAREFGGPGGGDIAGKDNAVVAGGCGAGKIGDHAIYLFGIVHVAPDEEPSFLERRGIGGCGRLSGGAKQKGGGKERGKIEAEHATRINTDRYRFKRVDCF